MHRRYRALLILGLMLAAGAAWAQGMGMGSGVDDIRRVGGSGFPPTLGNCILYQAGACTAYQTGGNLNYQ